MSKVDINTDDLKEALKTYEKVIPFVYSDKNKTTILFSEENRDVLSFLQDNMPLNNRIKTKIGGFLYASEKLGAVLTASPSDFYNKVSFINDATSPVLEAKINNKWYPLLASFNKFKTYGGGWAVELTVSGNLGYLVYSKSYFIADWSFEDQSGEKVEKTIDELLGALKLRVASKESIKHAKDLSDKVFHLNTKVGKVFDAIGNGLHFDEMWHMWHDINIGSKDSPVQVIIENVLENRYANHDLHAEGWQLPFVRVFSLKHKNYIFADIEDLVEHVYHKDGKDKIVLPKKIKSALESVFNAQQDHIFGDVFHGRHGGIVVLANGPSGVGKTLTAEVFAEFQEKPLYVMEMSEVGTSLQTVEANLKKIFARAKRWGAVLLFDEADIFLSERVASDLERSAIVGIFLRLLDYYEGTFFLTTNRGEGIDTAFKSRVTLYIDYPPLTPATRDIIWKNMLSSANIELQGIVTDIMWNNIINSPLNGRQIRNQVRLLKLMYPNNKVTTTDIWESLEFAAK